MNGVRRGHRQPTVRLTLRSLLRPSRFALVGLVGIAVNAAALVVFTEWLGIHYAPLRHPGLAGFHAEQLHPGRSSGSSATTRRIGTCSFRYLAFNALNVATLFIRIPVLVIFTERFGVHYLASNFIAIGLTFGIRYFVADNWIWAGRDTPLRSGDQGGGSTTTSMGSPASALESPLPELAAFNVSELVVPDIVVARRRLARRRPARSD